ncbi:MAG: D-2-hydroxyacid dehydrogenase family protein [Methylobacteriaceae bacterium]|nr:D-2-hydroxyacid dehydrogenase family protein [Methylobacteriaceae bacterium]
MLRCALLDDYQSVALKLADWSRLAGAVTVESVPDILPDRDAVVARLADCDILVAMRERTPFDAATLARLPKLRLLVTTGMRNAAIDLEAAARQGVTVCGTTGGGVPAAELTWALLLALMKRIPEETRNFAAGGRWQLGLGRELAGRTLGVVGLGRIGAKVAGYGRAFDMRVLGLARSEVAARSAALGAEPAASLDDLLARADVVSLHVTLTPQTRGLIGARELALMKPGAVLVNTARGPIVDEAALIEALRSGRLAGAALDVFDREPLPSEHPLRSLPNVVATPHLGYVTEETYRAWYGQALHDVEAWLAGAPQRVLAQPG